ncbi:MAG: hypothetical protein AMXMBFR84_29110 [Candidatus Hydrogenedentota bacterium]
MSTKINRNNRRRRFIGLTVAVMLLPWTSNAAQLFAGSSTASITPDGPVALSGQMNTRIASIVESEVLAVALALESRDAEVVVDQAIMVACDLVAIREGILDKVRERITPRLTDFDPSKLLLSATHTHTAPVTEIEAYTIPKDDVIQPEVYVEFLADRVAGAVIAAWESRKPAKAGWGLGHAVVAQNRRSIYADGHAQMYGPTDKPDFRAIEGGEDQGVEVLFIWNEREELVATAVNIACPSQEVEGRSAVNADFWHNVRETLQAKYGPNLAVLGWTGAAGDQSPHLMVRKAAEERMRELRGIDRLEELARRIVAAWEEAYEGAAKEKHSDLKMQHTVRTIELPLRTITEKESAEARAHVESLSHDPNNRRRVVWHQSVVDRYEQQLAGQTLPYLMELHAIRLGDIVIVTNDFELFTEYGLQMKARSKALQTFVIQLAGPGTYVPTERAAKGGGYSAVAESNVVGFEGGQVLTEKTVEAINALWPEVEAK